MSDAHATPARGGDELREALHSAIHRARHEWVCTHGVNGKGVDDAIYDAVMVALASTDMAGAGEGFARGEVAYGCAVDAASICYPGANQAAERDAFCSGAAYNADGSLPGTTSPVEGLTSGEGCVPCERCQGNGEIVTDWDRYEHARAGDVGDEAVSDCPDCDGTGRAASPKATTTASVREADHG